MSLWSRNLAARLATAAVVLPVVLSVFFIGPPWLGVAVIALACTVALHEFSGLVRARGLVPSRAAGLIVFALAFVEAIRPDVLAPVLPVIVVGVLTLALAGAMSVPDRLTATALTLLGGVYVGSLGGCAAALLLMAPAGAWRLFLLLAVIMISDSTAYFTGRRWGRHRLAPGISPGKTVEGAVGALAGGIPAALIVCAIAFPTIPATHAILLGAVVTLLGMAGDLAESLMKRWAGVKDSGVLFPGHGGMLDRLDSLLFAAPGLYYYFRLLGR